jgi:hypothetical protein
VANEITKIFGLQKRIDQSILNQKNALAEILMRGNRLMVNTKGKRFEVGLSDKED